MPTGKDGKGGIERNRPSDARGDDGHNLRDDSALQPGISTISDSNSDDANEHLTRTAGDSFRSEDADDGNADPAFDEIRSKE